MNWGRFISHAYAPAPHNRPNMDIESGTQSFVIKVWLEDTGEEATRATWRGHITHVPSGEKRYFKSPEEVTAFIASRLEAMGAAPQPRDWAERWIERFRARLRRTWKMPANHNELEKTQCQQDTGKIRRSIRNEANTSK